MEKNLLVRVSLIECEQYKPAETLWFDNFTLDDIRKVGNLESSDLDIKDFFNALCELVYFSDNLKYKL